MHAIWVGSICLYPVGLVMDSAPEKLVGVHPSRQNTEDYIVRLPRMHRLGLER